MHVIVGTVGASPINWLRAAASRRRGAGTNSGLEDVAEAELQVGQPRPGELSAAWPGAAPPSMGTIGGICGGRLAFCGGWGVSAAEPD